MKTKTNFVLALLALASALVLIGSCAVSQHYPATPQKPVINVYHGQEVVDPYQWLEDFSDPAVKHWSEMQNARARAYLDNLPYVNQIKQRLLELEHKTSDCYYSLDYRGGKFFAVKHVPGMQQSILITMESVMEPEKYTVVLDLNKFDPTGSTSMDWYKPSPDGKLVAVSLSVGGTESGDVYVFQTETGKQVYEVIKRVNGGTAAGDLAWDSDSTGFYYTRYPRKGERPDEDLPFYQQVWYHRLGTSPQEDRYEIGKEFAKIVEIKLQCDHTTGMVLSTVQFGDSGRFAFYLRKTDGKWIKIADYADGLKQGTFAPDGRLLFVSCKDAPKGKIIEISANKPSLSNAKLIVPEGKDTIVHSFGGKTIVPVKNGIFLTYQLGGPTEIRFVDYTGKLIHKPKILPISSVSGLTAIDEQKILFSNTSYTVPPAWYIYDSAAKKTKRTALVVRSAADFSDTQVLREFTYSNDGTKIPVNIICLKGTKRNGKNPVLLTGYGGYGISQTPRFLGTKRLWIEQGGVYAIANIRGGGEFGELWHKLGRLTHKQNVFDDFAAAMRYMIQAGFTNPQLLAIEGGSNGGLLMGAMITQHPYLCRAVVSHVGIYDMLRVELSPNGLFNIPEFGTVRRLDHFKALYAYSPYHHVRYGVEYPSVLFLTGANDPRVDPMQSRKMTAMLQAKTASKNPILLRTSANTGHGGGAPLNARIAKAVDVYAFLFHELGLKYTPAAVDK